MSLIDWIIGPKEPEPLPIYDDETAIRYVRGLGHTVIRTTLPPPPIVGQCWKPTRGKAPPRWVRSVGATEMSYATTQSDMGVMITRRSWETWVRKTRARVG